MSHLLDVNVLLACAWSMHVDHARANRWLDAASEFVTCPVTQIGFLRVSLSPGYGALFADAQTALQGLLQLPSHRFITDATRAEFLPELAMSKDVTDAHLVQLADRHGLKLATLDLTLCRKPMGSRHRGKPALTGRLIFRRRPSRQ